MSIRSSEFLSRAVLGPDEVLTGRYRLSPPLAMKHGFTSVEEYHEKALERFSLLHNGIIQKPSCRLLLINVSTAIFSEPPWVQGNRIS